MLKYLALILLYTNSSLHSPEALPYKVKNFFCIYPFKLQAVLNHF